MGVAEPTAEPFGCAGAAGAMRAGCPAGCGDGVTLCACAGGVAVEGPLGGGEAVAGTVLDGAPTSGVPEVCGMLPPPDVSVGAA